MSQRIRPSELRKMQKRIFFRADASSETGFGHFVRSLALADMLKDDFECIMVSCEPDANQKKMAEGVCKLVELPADDSRFPRFLRMLSCDDIVVLDNYFFTTEYQKTIKDKGCRLVCIDDIHDRHFVSDIVINHGFADPDDYDCEDYTKLCLGPHWALLRRPFLTVKRPQNLKKDKIDVTICFGGSDPLGLTDKIHGELNGLPQIGTVRAITGINLSAEEMAEAFRSCDVAIVSMSTVALEALACGAKVAGGWYVENQRDLYREYTERGLICPLGDLSKRVPSGKEILKIIDGTPLSKETAVPSDIPQRYVRLFKNLAGDFEFVSYTDLNDEDKMMVLHCRNDWSVRQWMTSTDKITTAGHYEFIGKLKSRKDAFYWAVFENGEFIGSVSIAGIANGNGDFGIFLNPKLIGSGYGTKLMEAAFRKFFGELGLKKIYSTVNRDNIRAIALYTRLGFTIGSEEEGFRPISITKEKAL